MEVMNWVWESTEQRVFGNSKVMRENQHPREHLPFKEYKVGDFCFIKRIPRRFYNDKKDERSFKLNAKLQPRWTGPFLIVEQKSPVNYIADIHNERNPIHAINMRPS